MSYFLANGHQPITPKIIVESVQSFYLDYADYDLSGYVEFAIAVVVFYLGLVIIQGSIVSSWASLTDYFAPFINNVRRLASEIDVKQERNFNKIAKCSFCVLGIIFHLLKMLFIVFLCVIFVGLGCLMVWYSGKYFVHLF
jgi:hypothetical protein